MACKWQVEIDPWARRVLAKHWPGVLRHDDVRTFPPAEGDWHVDLICGGFPCQDISFAGKGDGLDGERSGLFFEILRIASLLRPRLILLENVSALLVRGMDRVLGELASLGYDAEWECLPAAAFGAPHIRDRIFLLAYNGSDGWEFLSAPRQSGQLGIRLAATSCDGQLQADLPASCGDGLPSWAAAAKPRTDDPSHRQEMARRLDMGGRWIPQPGMVRVADGIPSRMDAARLKALGNAVVPQVAEFIGRLILEHASR